MALTNVLLLSQIAGYIIGLILSLCIFVPMSMHQDEFNGHCLLFSEGSWQEEDGQLLVSWASRAYCDFVIVVGVIMFIVCCVQIYRLSMFLYRGQDSSFLSAFVEAVVCGALVALAVCAALLVTLGFLTWCQHIVQRFPRCLLPLEPQFEAPQDAEAALNLVNTHFGYVIGGRIPTMGNPCTSNQVSCFCLECKTDANRTVRQFRETESVPQFYKEHFPGQELCDIKRSVQLSDHRFKVDLPLEIPKEQVKSELGDSFNLAYKRFLDLENKLHKDKRLFVRYKENIEQYLDMGFSHCVDNETYSFNKDAVCFLPHLGVINDNSETTKGRWFYKNRQGGITQ